MAYIKINGVDYSAYCNELTINRSANYNAQRNAAGNTVVDLINYKRTIEVGIIPLDNNAMILLQLAIANLNVSLSFLNPNTNELEENVNCIIPESGVSYYTIQQGKVMYKAFKLVFTEL